MNVFAGSTLSFLNYLIEEVLFVGVGDGHFFQTIIIKKAGGLIKECAHTLILISTKTRSSINNADGVFLCS